MPLGTEVGLGPGHILLDGGPSSLTEKGTAAPHFSTHFGLARSPISAIAELLLLVQLRRLRVTYILPQSIRDLLNGYFYR